MTETEHGVNYRVYWLIWLFLLMLTLIMIGLDFLSIPRAVLILLLILVMLTKASLIGAYFMHLRFERLGLVLSVGLGILVTGAILFILIMPDGLRGLELSPH